MESTFLSTLSLRRATVTVLGVQHRIGISIHALLAESDICECWTVLNHLLFLSTLSLRRATSGRPETRRPCAISIHALLAESDLLLFSVCNIVSAFLSTLSLRRATIVSVGLLMFSLYFYPRSPCGERQRCQASDISVRRISIHALLAESDSPPSITPTASRNFYPRSPCGERP